MVSDHWRYTAYQHDYATEVWGNFSEYGCCCTRRKHCTFAPVFARKIIKGVLAAPVSWLADEGDMLIRCGDSQLDVMESIKLPLLQRSWRKSQAACPEVSHPLLLFENDPPFSLAESIFH